MSRTTVVRREELRTFAVRTAPHLALAAAVGAGTGLAVTAFDRVVIEVLGRLRDAPIVVVALAPTIGLLLAALVLHTLGQGASSSTSDVYVEAFHDATVRERPRTVAARVLAAAATLASGNPLGLEGPSIYMGGAIGAAVQRRLPRLFRNVDHRVLMVAGAAAGVAAIFKAPATGVVFALEVPYQGELARRMLLPALVSSATSYLVFAAVNGTDPLFAAVGDPAFDLRDLAGAVALGLAAGASARLFSVGVQWAKSVARTRHPVVRACAAGAVLAGLLVAVRGLTGENLTFGPGYGVIAWTLDPEHAVGMVLAVLVLRCLATVTTVAGGGAGGLFVPLVVGGALLGRAVGGIVDALDTSLFVVVGVAAFLGAGYRVPLAAVMFVAETTGRPGFVVPGLLAAVAAELVMGHASVATGQTPSSA